MNKQRVVRGLTGLMLTGAMLCGGCAALAVEPDGSSIVLMHHTSDHHSGHHSSQTGTHHDCALHTTAKQLGIRLSYDTSDDLSAVTVYRKKPSASKWTELCHVTGSHCDGTYLDESCKNGQVYQYKVVCHYTDGTTETSDIQKKCWFEHPSHMETSCKSGSTSIRCIWEKNAKADGYILYYSTHKDMNDAVKCKVKKAEYTIKKASAKRYYIQVRAYRQSGGTTYYGAKSEILKVTK